MNRPRLIRFHCGRSADDDLRSPHGILQAAFDLLRSNEVEPAFARELEATVDGLCDHLAAPRGVQPGAVCWFRDSAAEPLRHAWALVRLLRTVGVAVRVETTADPGQVVYEDSAQVAAVPRRDTYRTASARAPRPPRPRKRRRP